MATVDREARGDLNRRDHQATENREMRKAAGQQPDGMTKKLLRCNAVRTEKVWAKKSRNLSTYFKTDKTCLIPMHRIAWHNPLSRHH